MIAIRFPTVLLLFVTVAHSPLCGQSRFETYTAQARSAPDQARVLSASIMGADGVEWFSGGGFQPDGTIVAAGTSLGPRLTADGSEKVLGSDTEVPSAPDPVQASGKGGPKTRSDGSPVWEKFKWTHPNATGFVARFSPDGSRRLGLVRFPWKSGSVTDACTGADGRIYLTGAATEESLASWGVRVEAFTPAAEVDSKAPVSGIYLACLSADASKIEWVRHLSHGSPAPSLSLDREGRIIWQGTDVRIVDPAGRLVNTLVIPGGLSGKIAVNPENGAYARYGERHSPTGREPWRCPILNIHRPDGTWELELYNWSGPVVGLDLYRLVSDSAIRGAGYDAEGNLLIHAWSDGGNSVMLREPFDLSQNAAGFKGLGWSAWGAGVLSCAYVIKLDPLSWRVKYGTLLAAYLKDSNKPNSLWIDAMGLAVDGAVCLAGRSAAGLIQTGNHIGGIEPDKGGIPSGNYIKILSSDLSRILFSSAIPGGGAAQVGSGGTWAMASGRVGGKTRVLYFSATEGKDELYGTIYPAPVVNSAQTGFGGGPVDACFILLELAQTEVRR